MFVNFFVEERNIITNRLPHAALTWIFRQVTDTGACVLGLILNKSLCQIKGPNIFEKIARKRVKIILVMGTLATILGFLLIITSARSDDSPKGPKVTHKVRVL